MYKPWRQRWCEWTGAPGHSCNGCFCPAALELLKSAIAKAGYTEQIVIGMDVAASEFYKEGKYDLDFKSPDDPSRYISPDQLGDIYKGFVKDYPGQPPPFLLIWIIVSCELLETPQPGPANPAKS